MKKLLCFALAILAVWQLANAVPAVRKPSTVTQSDGSQLTVTMRGDEWHHCLVTDDGKPVAIGEDGDVYYRTANGISTVRAHEKGERTAEELQFLADNESEMTTSAIIAKNPRAKAARSPRRKVGSTQVPTLGTPKVPIILVQYKDKKMSNTKQTFVSQYTSGSTSAYQYFYDQSNGKYRPQYDVYGIYTLDSNRATYGGNDSDGNDKGVGTMVYQAIQKAGNDIDWSQYDNDGDGEADVCIVVYAGVGEAQAYQIVPNAVWPCQWQLSDAASYESGVSGAVTRNGVTIDKFAVFNEINGSNDSSTQIDGVGTFCHEFSHCLGLPDFYETTYDNGYFGMGDWSLMDHGSYNNDGYTPIGYNAYEKNFMGWIDLLTPSENNQYTLPKFNQKSEATDVAYKVTSPINANEYYVLENRAKQGWDAYIPDEGMMVTHVSYIASRWNANTVNNQSVQLFQIIPADNSLSSDDEDSDLYGEDFHELTDTSTPAAKLYLTSGGSASGSAGHMGQPLTDIQLNNDGTVSFWYMKSESTIDAPVATAATYVTADSFTANWSAVADAVSYDLHVLKAGEGGTQTTLLSEDFSSMTGTGGNDGNFSGSVAATTATLTGWEFTKGGAGDSCVKLGTGSAAGVAVTPALNGTGDATLTFRAAGWANDSNNTVNISVSGGATASPSSVTLVSGEFSEYTVALSGLTASSQITFEAATTSKNRFFLDDVVVVSGAAASEITGSPFTGLTATSHSVTGLEAETGYTYYVVANDADGGSSPKSNVIEVTTNPGDPSAIADVVVSLDAGSYEGAQTATLTCATTNADILYTLDGTDPTLMGDGCHIVSSGAQVSIVKPCTLRAISADASTTYWSNEVTRQYVIYAAAPTFSPADTNQFSNPLEVTIATTTPGAVICYTLDGTDPTESATSATSEGQSVKVTLTETTTINALATTGDVESEVASMTYTYLAPVVLPTPVAVAATDVTSHGFTANWEALDNVTKYELHVFTADESGQGEGASSSFDLSQGTLPDGVTANLTPSKDNNDRGCWWKNTEGSPVLTVAAIDGATAINSVVVTASTNDSSTTIDVTVGNTAYGDAQSIASGLSNKNQEYTFTGSANGDIVINTSVTSGKGVAIRQIDVNYTTGDGSAATIEIAGSPFNVEGTSKVVNDLEAETTYSYYVYGIDANNEPISEQSNTVEVTTLAEGTGPEPTIPTAVATAATNVTNAGFTANWEAVEDAANYKLSVYQVVTSEQEVQTGGSTATTTKTITIPLKEQVITTGTTYVSTEFDFTIDNIGFAANNVNPNTGQVKGNQTTAAANFYLYNTAAIPGKITGVAFDEVSGTLDDSKMSLDLGTSAFTSQGDGAGGNPTEAVWTVTGDNTFFRINFTSKGATTGAVTASNIVITYEETSTSGGGSSTVEVTDTVAVTGSPFITTDLSYNVTGLDAASDYFYNVVALDANNGNISKVSNDVNVTTLEEPAVPEAAVAVATAATDVTSSSFVANWEEAENAATYDLYVFKVEETVTAETEETIESNFTDKNLTVGEGELEWTSNVAPGQFDSANERGLQWSSQATPTLTATIANAAAINKVTVVASCNGSAELAVTVGDVAYGDAQEVAAGTDNKNTAYEFTGEESGEIAVSFASNSKSVWIKSITVEYAVEGGGEVVETEIPVEGCNPVNVEGTSWEITDLDAETTYRYYVVSKNEVDSAAEPSATIEVTTLAESTGIAGDINSDGSVDGSDVSALLEMVLSGGLTDAQMAKADLTGDGSVDGSDVSALLEMVLSGE